MSPPTEREFDMLIAEMRAVRDDLDAIKTTLAEQRGAFQVARWLAGGGGLAGVVALVSQFWAATKAGS